MNQSQLISEQRLRQKMVPPSLSRVVVVHGWASKRFDMWLLCRRLSHMGYDVVNWGYPSFRDSIERPAASLAEALVDFQRSERPHLHLVGHSMGGIVIRRALLDLIPDNLSRVVLLASPNGGSFVARRLQPWLGRFSKSLSELSDCEHSYVNQLGSPDGLEVGVLAATRDRVIKEPNVHFQGETDFATVRCGHGIMPWIKDTAVMTHRFLMTGRFELANRTRLESSV